MAGSLGNEREDLQRCPASASTTSDIDRHFPTFSLVCTFSTCVREASETAAWMWGKKNAW